MKKKLILLISSNIIWSCSAQTETNTFTTHSSPIFYKSVELVPLKLERNEEDQTVCYYKVREEKGFERKPKLIIIVNKDIDKVLFKKVES